MALITDRARVVLVAEGLVSAVVLEDRDRALPDRVLVAVPEDRSATLLQLPETRFLQRSSSRAKSRFITERTKKMSLMRMSFTRTKSVRQLLPA